MRQGRVWRAFPGSFNDSWEFTIWYQRYFEQENNKEPIVKGRIPSSMENKDNARQEPAESAETETSETSLTFGNYSIDETRDKMRSLTSQDSISQYITEDNVQQIIDGILEESNLSDLEDNGNTYL